MKSLADNIQDYKPAIKLTSIVSRRTLSNLRIIALAILIVCLIGLILSNYFLNGAYASSLTGIGLIAGSLWLELMLIFFYHNSYYFRGLNSIIGLEDEIINGATYDVAEAVLRNRFDVTLAFCNSSFGSIALLRSGLSAEVINVFLQSPRQPITANMVTLPETEIFSLIGLGKYLLTHDLGFKKMINETGISEEIFLGSLRWVVGSYHQEKRVSRWWSKDNLSKTQSIGREWSYGSAYLLNKYSRNINTSAIFSNLGNNIDFANEKIMEIESALARTSNSNVLLVGEAGVGKTDLILKVSDRMSKGNSLNAITGKHIITLDTDFLFSANKDKQSLQLTILNMLNGAALAGNIVIVIENFSNLLIEARNMDVHIPELIDKFLALSQLQFIVTDTPGAYHTHLETLGGLTRRFSEILIDTPDSFATTRILQNIALIHEQKFNLLFTYASLRAITTAADQYLVDGVMPDKAISLLVDVATKASQEKLTIISADFVYTLISTKTGVPAGPIKDSERDLLLHLEDRLHQQIIGQEKALSAIARTMRRARAGVQSTDKPLGSFLFLGPTGVGKTETAKGLANIFFAGEDHLQRIDMSEYSGEDALEHLIGKDGQVGVLPTLLREHPYCVLLLDEFEKASQSIHDLFLQILDEGIFTDARGMKINARNIIIIATSNAGSELILKTVRQRKELATLDQEIIDNIIKNGTFRPELINRFDSTIIFEPLSLGEQTQVAKLMLNNLYERVKDRGYTISVGEDLLELLVKKGYSPEFGARPMQRVLQDLIEEKISQKIISGAVQKGDDIPLTLSDFSDTELAV